MKTEAIGALKMEREQKQSKLFTECAVFFAFSDEQFQENKTPLQEGEKYVRLGMGGFLPKGKLDQFLEGMDTINKWFKGATSGKELRKAHILYELNNHEAFYTRDIESTVEALGGDYTEEEVQEVYNTAIMQEVN